MKRGVERNSGWLIVKRLLLLLLILLCMAIPASGSNLNSSAAVSER